MGSGLPPFNTTGQPAISLAYIETCSSGTTGSFIRFCYPYDNGYGFNLEDQCVMAYNTCVFIPEYEEKARVFYGSSLVVGQTVTQARQALVDDGRFHCGTNTTPMRWQDLPIYGDPNTRLETVYTRDGRPPAGWFLSPYP